MGLKLRAYRWFLGNLKLALFLVVAVVTVAGATIAFVWQTQRFECSQERILELQEQEYKHLISFIEARPGEFKVKAGELDVAGQVEKINQDTLRLLELEFGKMQSEYEVLELWAALITVVFLLFSFFSMFKSEELVRQGHDALARIGDMQSRTQTEVNALMQTSGANLREIEMAAKDNARLLNDDIKALKESTVNEINSHKQRQQDELDGFTVRLEGDAKARVDKLVSDYATELTRQQETLKIAIEDFGRNKDKLFDEMQQELKSNLAKVASALASLDEAKAGVEENVAAPGRGAITDEEEDCLSEEDDGGDGNDVNGITPNGDD